VDEVVKNAQYTMDVCGEKDVPLFRGEDLPHQGVQSESFWGKDGFGQARSDHEANNEMIKLSNLREESAVDFLIRITKEHKDVAIVCMAPLANLAAACRKDPSFPSRVSNLVVLGGTYLAQGNTDFFCSEYNFFKDPDSAQVVFDKFPSITLVPLEATFFQRMLPVEVNLKPY